MWWCDELTSMFTLGDSHIDTGNALIIAAPVMPIWTDKPPYGETFFGHPAGRFSDGRVIIDFIAEEFGLPFLPAVLAKSSNVSQGVNFAVGGATAVEVGFLERNNLVPFKLPNNSELGWFGFVGDVLKACCGAGGAYNWDPNAFCGMPGAAACRNPSAYVSWDGVHYTEAANRYIARGWLYLYGPYADPPILTAVQH
ncbi:GDSL esterase/lipase At1g31550-like [Phragmites australis]|uniref:GDSL esterase/lipase At1g31550-like n=1 Tax=Phragmites australis TaxID=29695 RepID=UPI002D77D894|nr:GDSL esterase/lipase At1g31550-like [Phragmites australis]